MLNKSTPSVQYSLFELCWGLGITLVSIYVYIKANAFPDLPGNIVGPGTFPSIIAAILFPCRLLLVIQNVTSYFVQDKSRQKTELNWLSLIAIFVAVLLIPLSNVFFAEQYGFVLISTLTTTCLMSLMRRGKFVSSFIISFIAVSVFSWIFSNYLLVPLPTGDIF
ncbi:hypothetical protein MACH09_31170 [Vibrio sp. MACH09]|uniref:tripartite tricarboxylate transporter TctB family protein n=1 Tax=Vibrio sp. MACH09 TaxID=3025122 RepID=UPI00279348A6|nr:tripartite tricarboxylate transporter TctB family protein [Vibrio sp. MACH09]GLO62609.1 hypothetical protein MACH09_31170 [Vibrio sp. MACH09]